MIFDSVIGHKRQVQILKIANLGQAYLLSGPSGVGKKLLAQAAAQRILCEKNEPLPCGHCPSCLAVKNLAHPDLLYVSTTEAILKIDIIREIQGFINLRSFKNHGKVVIIDESQKMNVQAANALLKSLEEPPTGCHFFLITSSRGAMLPTIQSRCQKINFGCLTTDEIQKIKPDAPAWVLPLAQGRLDLLELWTEEENRNLRQKAFTVFENIVVSRKFEGFEKVAALSEDSSKATFTAQLWQNWIRQILTVKLGLKAQGSSDEIKVFQNLATQTSLPALFQLSEKLLTLEKDIRANVNRKLSFEKFWMDMKNNFTQESL